MQDLFLPILSFFAGMLFSYLLFARFQKKLLEARVAELSDQLKQEKSRAQGLEGLLNHSKETFKGASMEALKTSSDLFLNLAKTTFEKAFEKNESHWQEKAQSELKPIREALEKCSREINELEKVRVGAYASLKEQLGSLLESQRHLKRETGALVNALRAPQVRGRWGEVQLKRVVELAGMIPHCDFLEQPSESTESGRLRPDLIVRLPGGRSVIVDAKVPLAAYLESIECADDEARRRLLEEHARQLKAHISQLSKKGYGEHFEASPEFVVLFLPAESLFSAALQADPTLLEAGAEARVILATPSTLIGLLKSIAYGWRQEKLSRSAEEIAALGRELYKRLADLGGHFAKIGRGLESAVEAYNKTCGSFESRVLVSARRFEELHSVAEGNTLESPSPVDRLPRKVSEE